MKGLSLQQEIAYQCLKGLHTDKLEAYAKRLRFRYENHSGLEGENLIAICGSHKEWQKENRAMFIASQVADALIEVRKFEEE